MIKYKWEYLMKKAELKLRGGGGWRAKTRLYVGQIGYEIGNKTQNTY
jgi:hypothetical protein